MLLGNNYLPRRVYINESRCYMKLEYFFVCVLAAASLTVSPEIVLAHAGGGHGGGGGGHGFGGGGGEHAFVGGGGHGFGGFTGGSFSPGFSGTRGFSSGRRNR